MLTGIFDTGLIQASTSKIQGLLKASPTVFKDLKLMKNTSDMLDLDNGICCTKYRHNNFILI